eukprot:764067-Hanusia_phi.AAC.4
MAEQGPHCRLLPPVHAEVSYSVALHTRHSRQYPSPPGQLDVVCRYWPIAHAPTQPPHLASASGLHWLISDSPASHLEHGLHSPSLAAPHPPRYSSLAHRSLHISRQSLHCRSCRPSVQVPGITNCVEVQALRTSHVDTAATQLFWYFPTSHAAHCPQLRSFQGRQGVTSMSPPLHVRHKLQAPALSPPQPDRNIPAPQSTSALAVQFLHPPADITPHG